MIKNRPRAVVLNPRYAELFLEMQLADKWFWRIVKSDWRRFKEEYRPHWHARWVQRKYVRFCVTKAQIAAHMGLECPGA